jgi:MerR family transcriptional regulator, light-induced transcriptional regulator
MYKEGPTYNLKAVVRETGINAETLRAWERRYGLLKPDRTPGGHRVYSLRDIQMLKWLVSRQAEGLSISRAVELWRGLEESGQDPLLSDSLSRVTPAENDGYLEEYRRRWIKACLDFNESEAEQILSQAFSIAPIDTVCIEVLQNGLRGIGEKWYAGEATVQQEHFASALATRRLHALISATPAPSRPGHILVACPPFEDHEFGLLLITFLLRRRGWNVVFLGANVPIARLESTVKATSPILAILASQTLPGAAALMDMANVLDRQGILVAYGGLIFNVTPEVRSRIRGSFLGEEIKDAPQQVENILARKPELDQTQPIPSEYVQLGALIAEKQPLIMSEVTSILRSYDPDLDIDIAHDSFREHLLAALELGDINYLNNSMAWVEKLLINHGMTPQMLHRYLEVYYQSAEKHLEGRGNIILSWLRNFIER